MFGKSSVDVRILWHSENYLTELMVKKRIKEPADLCELLVETVDEINTAFELLDRSKAMVIFLSRRQLLNKRLHS